MESIINLLNIEVCQAIFQTLLHSLWQITLLALVVKLIIRYRYPENLAKSYAGHFAVMILSLFASVATFTFYYFNLKQNDIVVAQDNSGIAPLTAEGESLSSTILSQPVNLTEWIAQYDQIIVVVWMIGVVFFLTKIILGWIGMELIKSRVNYQLPVNLLKVFNQLKLKLSISKPVKLGISNRINVPMVFGHAKPIILLPLASINQLELEEVEAILIHEMAHILHSDFLKNIVVMIGEALYFYHPVIWLLSKDIKEERENLCDDKVVHLYPNRIHYAKILVRMQELHHGNHPNIAMALFSKKFTLMKRIQRILNMPTNDNYRSSKALILGMFLFGFFIFSSAFLIQKNDDVSTPESELLNDFVEKENAYLEEAFNENDQYESDGEETGLSSLSQRTNRTKLSLFSIPVQPIRLIGIDTITPEQKEEMKLKYREKKEELREKTRELRDKMRAAQEKIENEYASDLEEKRTELRALRKEMRDNSDSNDFEYDFDSDEWEEWAEGVEEWAEDFAASFSEQFDDEWVSEWEEWGAEFEEEMTEWGEEFSEEMEAWGEEFGEGFGEKWSRKMERLGTSIERNFDEDFFESIAEMGARIGEAVGEAMEDIEIDGLEYDITMGDTDNGDELKEALVEMLTYDKLLKDRKNTIEITDDKMTVNKERQSNEMLKKYITMVKKYDPSAFRDGRTTIKFKLDGKTLSGSKRTSLSVEIDD